MQLSTSTNLVHDVTSPRGGEWTPEEREQLEAVRAFTPEQRAEALAATRAKFTEEDLAEIKLRQCEGAKLIDRLAATETLEEQQQLADQLCPEFDAWVRGRNRVRNAARRPRVVATIVARGARAEATPRERRDSSSSRSSGQDPGDSDPEQDDGPWALGFVDRAPFLWRFRALRCRLLEIREGVDR